MTFLPTAVSYVANGDRVLHVREVNGKYRTCWRGMTGECFVYRSSDLPARGTPKEAQEDLDAYAVKRKLEMFKIGRSLRKGSAAK